MKKQERKAVFLDRDGVINRSVIRNGKPYPPSSLEDVEILPGVPEALEKLKEAGFFRICITNQPDVARGRQRREVVEEMHKTLLATLSLDEILVCYHNDCDKCQCRKPLPGMLLDAAKRLSINLVESFMVGDRWRDIEAGRSAGCRTIFIEFSHAEREPGSPPDFVVRSLHEASELILEQTKAKEESKKC